MRAGLLTTTFLQAMSITQDKRSYKDTAEDDVLRAQIDVSGDAPLQSRKHATPCHNPLRSSPDSGVASMHCKESSGLCWLQRCMGCALVVTKV